MDKQRKWIVLLLAALCMCAQAVFPAAAGAAAPVAPDPVAVAEEQRTETWSGEQPVEAPDALDAASEDDEAVPLGRLAVSEDVEEAPLERVASSDGRIWVQGYNTAGGYILVQASDTPKGENVLIEAWSNAAPDEKKFYEAEAVSGGVFDAKIPIADFDFREGWYTFHGCTGSEEDAEPFGEEVTAPVSFAHGTLHVGADDETETAFNFLLKGAEIPDKTVAWLQVRSEDGSSKRVYPLMPRAIGRAYRVYVQHHGKAGAYTATAYLGTPSRMNTVLCSTSFKVDGVRDAKVEFTDVDGSTGSFGLSLAGQAPSGFKSVRFAVWSEEDRSDLQWYDAEEQDGTYVASTSIDAHNGSFGNYTTQAHVVLGNGIEMMAAETTAEIAPHNYVYAEKIGQGQYRVAVLAPDPSEEPAFRVASWSVKNGQDDMVWYDAAEEDNGEVSAVVKLQNHNSAGQYIAHVYNGDEYIGAVSFDVPATEMLSPAELRIAEACERVYDEVGTDLYDNYLWVVDNFSYVRRYGHLTPDEGYTREQWYAVEGLETQSGNCYTFAAAFCELAEGLGYDATYVEGAVYGVGQQWWPHGFVLIRRNGATYICDPELQYASSTGRNLYMQPISNPKATYRW